MLVLVEAAVSNNSNLMAAAESVRRIAVVQLLVVAAETVPTLSSAAVVGHAPAEGWPRYFWAVAEELAAAEAKTLVPAAVPAPVPGSNQTNTAYDP